MVDIKVPRDKDPFYQKIRKLVVKYNMVKPEHIDALTEDMYQWAYKNRRDMTMEEFDALLRPYK